MKTPARHLFLTTALLGLVLLSLGRLISPSAAAATDKLFYGEDRQEIIFGQPVMIDVDGQLLKETREGSSCVERFDHLTEASPSSEDQAESHLIGVRCAVDRLRAGRLYLSFDTSEIPSEAVISAARLYLTKDGAASNEFTARFEILTANWTNPTNLNPTDWGSGAKVVGTFDAPADDPEGTLYTIPLDATAIKRAGRTQLEIRLYDEAGESGFYGNFPEQVLQKSRQRAFYSGDAAPQNLQPRLEISLDDTAPPPAPALMLWAGWNKVWWTEMLPEGLAPDILAAIDRQCGEGTILAASYRSDGFWESLRYRFAGANFAFQNENVYYLLVSRDCPWEGLEQ